MNVKVELLGYHFGRKGLINIEVPIFWEYFQSINY